MQHANSERKRSPPDDVPIDVDALPDDLVSTQIVGGIGCGGLEEEELLNPTVNIQELFSTFNAQYFWNSLDGVYVEFSKRMTLCAGTCTFLGKAGGCRIALSEPLLKLRPRSDLISTLLHEMIHAYLFLTDGTRQRDGPDGHGPKFMAHANRINVAEKGRVSITPYHSFRDEVDVYRVHHWKCDKCEMLVKRAMNRAPAPRDPWWPRHNQQCGGQFVKIKEPEKKKLWKRPKKFHGAFAVDASARSDTQPPPSVVRTQRIENMFSRTAAPRTFACPVCGTMIAERSMNSHLDQCISPDLFSQAPSNSSADSSIPAGSLKNKPRPHAKPAQLNTSDSCITEQNDNQNNKTLGRLKKGRKSEAPRADVARKVKVIDISKVDNRGIQVSSSRFRGEAKGIEGLSAEAAVDALFGGTDVLMDFAIHGGSDIPFIKENGLGCDHLPSLFENVPQASESDAEGEPFKSAIEPLGPHELSKLARERFGIGHHESTHCKGQESFCKAGVQNQSIKTGNLEMHDVPQDVGHINAVGKLIRTTSPKEPAHALPAVSQGRRQPAAGSAPQWPRSSTEKPAGSSTEEKEWQSACPICDKKMPRSKIERHVNYCLDRADLDRSFVGNDEVPNNERSPTVPVSQAERGIGTARIPESDTRSIRGNQDRAPCPICEQQIDRSRLESHTASCIASTGIMDAFT